VTGEAALKRDLGTIKASNQGKKAGLGRGEKCRPGIAEGKRSGVFETGDDTREEMYLLRLDAPGRLKRL